jgi:general stress protein 26
VLHGTWVASLVRMSTNDQTKLDELLEGVRIAMLTTIAADGSLHARPMALQRSASDEEALWFITGLDSEKARESEADEHVNVSIAKGDDRWVSISGTARVVRDQARLEEFWSPFAEAWFPNGPSDPNVGLMRVQPRTAEYWESNSPKPVRMLQMARAALTKQPPSDLGTSGTLRLTGESST